MNDIPVTVNILDRNYKLKVAPGDEAFLLSAAEKINSQISAYKKNYAYQDFQDLLAMVAIAKTTQLNKLEHLTSSTEASVRERLGNLEAILDKVNSDEFQVSGSQENCPQQPEPINQNA